MTTDDLSSSRNMDELKRLVISAMDKNGVLGQLRSSVKLHVSKIINNEEIPSDRVIEHRPSEKLAALVGTERGQLMVELISDFLHTYELRDTLAILLSESNMNKTLRPSQQELASVRGVAQSGSSSILEQCLMGARQPTDDVSPLTRHNAESPQVYSPPDINPNTSLENDMNILHGISDTISHIVDGETSPLPSLAKFSNPIDDNVLFESRESFKDLNTNSPVEPL
jgi:hypothetical protein